MVRVTYISNQEHKEELKVRETKRMQEEARLKDQEKYQKNQTFSQTGYLKSILEPGESG